MAWSEKAIEAALNTHWQDRGNSREKMRAALDAAAAVDGDPVSIATVTAYESGHDAGWNEALDKAAKMVLNTRDEYEWKHSIKASQQISGAIRALKRG